MIAVLCVIAWLWWTTAHLLEVYVIELRHRLTRLGRVVVYLLGPVLFTSVWLADKIEHFRKRVAP